MTLTHWIVLVTFALWIWYTSVSRQMFGAPTISMTMRNIAWDFSLFPFVWGMLVAHWFAPKRELVEGVWGWGIGLPIMGVLLAIDLYFLFKHLPRNPMRWPFWYFLAGLPVGYWFWPQRSPDAPF
jgi:hypothetical protein